jgi:hypothetical protein
VAAVAAVAEMVVSGQTLGQIVASEPIHLRNKLDSTTRVTVGNFKALDNKASAASIILKEQVAL